MKIELIPYNPSWKQVFCNSKIILEKISSELRIEHIGSTSVPGIMAKPIIDILIGAPKQEGLNELVNPIIDLGFQYISKYEKEIPERRFFIREQNKKRTHHIHLVHFGTHWYKRHIAFRDELRNNARTKKEYENLKLELSKKDWSSGDDYSEAKTEFILEVENKILHEDC